MSNITTTNNQIIPQGGEWVAMTQQAKYAVDSGLLPKAINTPQKAITIMLKGRELGLPPMQALSHIHIINGKPCISAELMLSLIFTRCKGAVIDYIELSDQRCIIEAARTSQNKRVQFCFTLEDAKRAQLLGKGTWQQYPRQLLRARCITEMARTLFPDCIMGASYTPEEMGADDTSNEVQSQPGTSNEVETKSRARKALEAFAPYNVDRAMIEKYFCTYLENLNDKEIAELSEMYLQVKNGIPAKIIFKEIQGDNNVSQT